MAQGDEYWISLSRKGIEVKELNYRLVKRYCFIDRLAGGLGCIEPKSDEVCYYLSEFHGDHTENFIVTCSKNGCKVVGLANMTDISFVDFDDGMFDGKGD